MPGFFYAIVLNECLFSYFNLHSMKYFISIFLIAVSLVLQAQSSRKLHFKSVLVDTHNDVLSSSVLDGDDISQRLKNGHSDFFRWKDGGLDVQFFSVWTGEKARNAEGFYKDANQEIDSLDRLVERNPDKIMKAFTYADVKKGIRQKKLVALIGVEGGHMIEDDMGKLEALYNRGMRYMTLTWNNSTSWATSARDEVQRPDSFKVKGLNELGKEIVKKMNDLGVMVDLSHVGEQTFYDAIALTSKPVILSHSSVWSICPVFRNVKDEQIKAVAKNKGVICINFYAGFIDSVFSRKIMELEAGEGKNLRDSLRKLNYDEAMMNKIRGELFHDKLKGYLPDVRKVVDHIDHIVKLAGVDYVGIGSDYDGISFPPKGLEDVTTYPLITEELKIRGYSNKAIKKILGGNVLRVMKANFR